jgi:hypothetical protein
MAVKTKAITLVISRIFSACSPGKPITIAIPYKHAESMEVMGDMESMEDIGKKFSKTLNTRILLPVLSVVCLSIPRREKYR